MKLFVGLDVSLEKTAICVLSEHGKIVKEVQVASEPEALLRWINDQDGAIAAVGLEAGPLSQWLHRGLSVAGQPVVLMETRQVKGALKAMPIKTDRRDAEGIARLLHLGWFRPVHCKSVSAQEVRAVLSARKAVQQGFITLEMSLRGLLRNFGLKVGTISRGRFEQRIRELAAGNPMLEAATEPMLSARSALRRELAGLERHVRQRAQEDPVCRRLMSMPGIGAVVALTYRSAVDDPDRFTSSKKVGPWVGLTPSRNQSGERDISGGITKAGDVNLRRALCQAATAMMHRGRASWLRTWAAKLARRRGAKRAMVALARRIAVILHRMWKDDIDFHFDSPVIHAGCPPDRGPSRSPRDAVPMMPCSGLMPITSSTPMRWAHRNCIEPASCWRPSRRPRTEACTRVDLSGRLPNRKADHFLSRQKPQFGGASRMCKTA